MSDTWLFIITGAFLTFCGFLVYLLDRRTREKGPLEIGNIPNPMRIICFVAGILFSIGFVVNQEFIGIGGLALFFFLIAFVRRKKGTQTISPYSPNIPYQVPSIISEPENENEISHQEKVFDMSNIFIRWTVILSLTALLIGGIIWLSKHPPSIDNGGIVIVMLIIVGAPILNIVHLFWIGTQLSKNIKKEKNRNQ